jgi:two-component system sensor histidine kinase QseC
LLAIAKLDAGLETSRGEDVNVGEVVADVIEALKPAAGSIRVELDPALHALSVRSNREILTLALRNLHENAIRHMPDGGTVSWRIAPDGNGVLVEDEGPGIPEEELPFVTQRFFRGQHKSAAGTGLGLAIVEVAATRLGGNLVLENRRGRSGLQATIVIQNTSTE